jgi:hypothetical protein
MDKKARAFSGWKKGTSAKLIAFRGWIKDVFTRTFIPPVTVLSAIKELEQKAISSIGKVEIFSESQIDKIRISTTSTLQNTSFFAEKTFSSLDIFTQSLINNSKLSVNSKIEGFLNTTVSIPARIFINSNLTNSFFSAKANIADLNINVFCQKPDVSIFVNTSIAIKEE